MSVDEIVACVDDLGQSTVLVTGGEPLLQRGVIELMRQLLAKGRTVLLETSGTRGPEAAVALSYLSGEEFDRIVVQNQGRFYAKMQPDPERLLFYKDDKLFNWMQPIFDNLDYLMHSEKKDASVRKSVDELVRNDMTGTVLLSNKTIFTN